MSNFKSASARSTENESSMVSRLYALSDEFSPLLKEERISSPILFSRRQEMSYIIANYELYKLIQNVKGNIYYFGVYHGEGFMTYANICAALEPFNHSRELIGFDTFEGYPEISKEDERPIEPFNGLYTGRFKSNSWDLLNELTKIYDENRPLNHIPKIKLVKGDVCDSLPQYMEENPHAVPALIILTMNLYKPTKTALSLLWPLLPKGGVIVAHCFNQSIYPGITKSIMEVIGTNIRFNTMNFAPNLTYFIK